MEKCFPSGIGKKVEPITDDWSNRVREIWDGKHGEGAPILLLVNDRLDMFADSYRIVRALAYRVQRRETVLSLTEKSSLLVLKSDCSRYTHDGKNSPYNGHVATHRMCSRYGDYFWNCCGEVSFISPHLYARHVGGSEIIAQVSGVTDEDVIQVAQRFFGRLPLSLGEEIKLFGWGAVSLSVQKGDCFVRRISEHWDRPWARHGEEDYESCFMPSDITQSTDEYSIYLGDDIWGVVHRNSVRTVRYEVKGVAHVNDLVSNQFSPTTSEQRDYLLARAKEK